MMNAIVYEAYGDSSTLQLKSVPIPKIADNEVLVKVRAAGVNPVDYKLRRGYFQTWPMKFPMIPGWDVSGTVSAVGANCSQFKVGDEVYCYNRPAFDMDIQDSKTEYIGDNGAYAEYVAVKEWKLAAKPKSISFEAAAGIPLAGLTAWQGIFKYGKLQAGQTVLVLNASGGVGSFAVQFAKEKGAVVIGTCSTRNVDLVKSLGADHVVDYTKEDVAKAVAALGLVIDVVYDCVGGDNVLAGISVVKNDGMVVSIANWGVAKLCQDAGKATGVAFLVQPIASELKEIADLIDSGKVKVAGLETLPLAEAAKAHDLSESGKTVGKLVLTVSSE